MASELHTMMVGWSGHRPEWFRDPGAAQSAVERQTALLSADDPGLEIVTGGQRGVDQWAVAFARDRGIPYVVVLPQPLSLFTREWEPADRRELGRLIVRARRVEIVDPAGALGPRAFDGRNERIAALCDRLEVVWTGLRRGGTFYTVCAAWQRGVPVALTQLEPATHPPPGRGS